MSSVLARGLAMGGLGAGGAAAFHHRDMLDQLLPSPAAGASPPGTRQVEAMLANLSNQVDHLGRAQHTHHYIAQPNSVVGVLSWKAVATAGVLGSVVLRATGYNLRDFAYVSKRHFALATDAIKEQVHAVEDSLGALQCQLMKRIGAVDDKIDEAQNAIELMLETEVHNIQVDISDVAEQINKIDAIVAQGARDTSALVLDVNGVARDMRTLSQELKGELAEVRSHMDDAHQSNRASQQAMREDVSVVNTKLDSYRRSTTGELRSLKLDIARQSRGIGLLCAYVHAMALPNQAAPELLVELDEFAKAQQVEEERRQETRHHGRVRPGTRGAGLLQLAPPTPVPSM